MNLRGNGGGDRDRTPPGVVDAPPFTPIRQRPPSKKGAEIAAAPMRRADERADKLYGACVQLALLTPVLAEAYINMFALILRRLDLRADRVAYEAVHAFLHELTTYLEPRFQEFLATV